MDCQQSDEEEKTLDEIQTNKDEALYIAIASLIPKELQTLEMTNLEEPSYTLS